MNSRYLIVILILGLIAGCGDGSTVIVAPDEPNALAIPPIDRPTDRMPQDPIPPQAAVLPLPEYAVTTGPGYIGFEGTWQDDRSWGGLRITFDLVGDASWWRGGPAPYTAEEISRFSGSNSNIPPGIYDLCLEVAAWEDENYSTEPDRTRDDCQTVTIPS